jgi:hypothetical protein
MEKEMCQAHITTRITKIPKSVYTITSIATRKVTTVEELVTQIGARKSG